jgi:hypothetical protein
MTYAADIRLGVQAKGDYEYMFISGEGHKAWYSALELEQIARAYAKDKKLDFNLDTAEKNIWVHTDGGKVLAEVWFLSGPGKPYLQILIGRKGNVLKHKIETKAG